jgi:hypothetical protein
LSFTLAAAATLIIHIILHWDWMVGVTKKFFSNFFHISRLNYIVNILLFIGFITIMTSGIAISRSVLPTFGLQIDASRSWRGIHSLASNLTLLLVAVHFALHWSWVKNTFIRLFIKPFQRTPQIQAQAVNSVSMKNAKLS